MYIIHKEKEAIEIIQISTASFLLYLVGMEIAVSKEKSRIFRKDKTFKW